MSGYCFCEHGYGQHGDASNPLRIDALGKTYTVEDANVCWVCDCEQFAKDPEGQAKKDAIKKADKFETTGCKYPTKSGKPCRRTKERWNGAWVRIEDSPGYGMGRNNYTQADGSPIRCSTHSLTERLATETYRRRDIMDDARKAATEAGNASKKTWQQDWLTAKRFDKEPFRDPEATHPIRFPKTAKRHTSFL